MLVPITALYAASLAFVGIFLQQLVGRERLRADVSLEAGGQAPLLVAIRRHANFSEHVPLALLLFALIELNGAPALLLHGLGVTLLVARVVHPFGLDADEMRRPARLLGALGTLVVTIVAAGVAGWQGLLG